MYLQSELPAYHIDCEYNRDGIDPKRIRHLALYPDAEDTNARTVYPDIIAHRRGTRDNFLVIEIKKSSNTEPRETDLAKLRGYRATLGYQHALFVELSSGDEPGVLAAQWID
jgi:hypothetical protein